MSEFSRPRDLRPIGTPRVDGEEKAVVEQAKGALMLRYGITSHEAFAILLDLSRAGDHAVGDTAYALVDGIRQRDDRTDPYEPYLPGWLEEQLRFRVLDDT